LTLAGRQLREAGFRQLRATSFNGKQFAALLDRWHAEGLSAGTLKNRLAVLRWWAEKIGRAGMIPADNGQLAVPERRFVTNESKARVGRFGCILHSFSLDSAGIFDFTAEGRVEAVEQADCSSNRSPLLIDCDFNRCGYARLSGEPVGAAAG